MKHLHLPLASAPALLVFEESPEQSGNGGTILFYHGFSASKEHYVVELEALANAGFLAIGIDAIGHGERRYPHFAERFPGFDEPVHEYNPEIEANFLSDVFSTAQEVTVIIDELIARGWSDVARIGIAGISMGAFVTYTAITLERRLSAAVSIVGSPHWRLPWKESPHLHAEGFFPTALLSQTASRDTTASPDLIQSFHKQLAPFYATAPERLGYIEYAEVGHELSEKCWQQAREHMVHWFERFLKED